MNGYNGIAEIRLTQSLFQQGSFIPAQINLIIGRNGRSAGEYRIMVFDRRYVLDNVMQYI